MPSPSANEASSEIELTRSSTGTAAKSVARKIRGWPKLLDFRAVFREPPSPDRSSPAVRIYFPDGGGSVSSDSPDVNDRLSRAFNRAVVLSSAAPSAPSLEEYWPDIDGLAHRETVTDETIGPAITLDEKRLGSGVPFPPAPAGPAGKPSRKSGNDKIVTVPAEKSLKWLN